MRRSIFLLILGFSGILAFGQSPTSWIHYEQEYYRILTATDAIHRLSYADLQNAGFPVATTDPRALRIFHRGTEQDIRVTGEEDGTFDPGDYLEFYGRRNDGTGDTKLYASPADQPHKYYNLYSDTTAFFLTFDPGMTPSTHRMTLISEANTTGIPPESFHYDEKLLLLADTYSAGFSEADLVTDTDFINGEGFTGLSIPNGQFREYTLSGINSGYPTGGLPQLELLIVGRGIQPHRCEIFVGSSAGSLRSLGTRDFSPYTTITVAQPLEWTDIGGDGKLVVRVATLGDAATFDRVSLTYARLRYPQQIIAGVGDKILRLRAESSGKAFLDLSGLPAQSQLYDVTDPAHVRRFINPAAPVIPNANTDRTLLLAGTFVTPPISKISFTEIEPSNYDYIIITHKSLMKPAMGYGDAVQAYADYRASETGGAFSPLVVEISQLYDQFNYGEISALAIRNFMQYLAAKNLPKYLFIIGEDIDIWYNYHRSPESYPNFRSLVPTAGYPGSDAFFTYNMAGAGDYPAVPTGRITSMKPEEVAAYLNKVKEMEALPFHDLWRKNILHLSGGIRPGEPERFRDYLGGFQKIAEDFYLGGSVKWAAKQSTDPVEFININQEVNKGLSLVTFYGHSASSVIDFDIGFVTDPKLGYENKGKYPMFLINGCNAGSFFLNGKLFGEDWINAPDKGAVGFIAHTSYGLEFNLKRYSEIFYQVAYGDSTFLYRGVGDIQQEVAKRFMTGVPRSIPNVTQVQQMLLLGDPAVALFGARKPDYELDETKVFIESFDGQPVTTFTDSLALRLLVPNYGMASKDTLRVRVTRSLSDGTAAFYDTLFRPVRYSDTLTVVIRKGDMLGAGGNIFTIELDPDNDIPELNEDNNTVAIEYTVSLNRTKNLFPHDFAIVNTGMVNLTFQSTDPADAARGYIIEFDTLNTFDSPWRSAYTVQGEILNRKEVTLLDEDSLTYYWRTRFEDPQPGESDEWEMSSFTFINDGPEGWAQMHFPQYLKNQSLGLVRDTVARVLGFEETITSVYINNFGSAAGVSHLNVSVKLNGTEYQINTQQKACRTNTINLIAFDKTSTVPYAPVPIKFQDFRTCGRQPQVINSFRLNEFYGLDPDTGEPAGVATAVDNVAPGDSVVLFSIGNAGYSSWPADIRTKLGEFGVSVDQINALQDGQPVIIYGRKGIAPGSATIFTGEGSPLNKQTLEVEGTVTGRYDFGVMTSALIGPALEWHDFTRRTDQPEPDDEVSVELVGVDLKGKTSVLMSGLGTSADLSMIDAETWPYLRLVFRAKDELNLTPVQLKSWLVTYTSVAEGIVFYQGEHEPVTLREGEAWTGDFGFVNISDKSFPDSLHVQWSVLNKSTRQLNNSAIRIHAPAPGDTTFFTPTALTNGMLGANDVSVFVNPRVLPEQYYENNLLSLPGHLIVEGDRFKPVLEVTFDGRLPADGDFVSANPEIALRLWDENRTLVKTDTAGVRIFLEYPCVSPDCDGNPAVYFSRDDVSWFPATDTTDFRVVFTPQNLPEGSYTLSVDVADASGNQVSPDPYVITFQVKYASSVLLLAPYPNPAVSPVVFTIVISGREAPDEFDLTLFGIDGRMVRHLRTSNIVVGTNEILWDGTDDAGRMLPGGVYPYKLVLRQEGQQVPVKVPVNTNYFRGGYGKVVLIR